MGLRVVDAADHLPIQPADHRLLSVGGIGLDGLGQGGPSGQAAGFAAALCVEKKCSPKELDSAQLRATMAEHHALLE